MKRRILSFFLALIIISGSVTFSNGTVSALTAMQTSQTGLDMIKGFEGFHTKAYWDYSQWTIGYGSCAGTNPKAPDIATITKEAAETLLQTQLKTYEGFVNIFLNKYSIHIKQNQFDALASFTYNFGDVWTKYASFDLKTYLINGVSHYTDEQITTAFTNWCHAGGVVIQGLVIRRQKEAAYFLSGDVQDTYSPENGFPTPIKCFAVSSGDITVKSVDLSTDITVDAGITEFTILGVDGSNQATVSFMQNSNIVLAVCNLTVFFSKLSAHYTQFTSAALNLSKRSDLSEPYAAVPAKTAYSVVGESGDNIQIVYRLASGGYIAGWVPQPPPDEFYTGRYNVNTADGSALNIRKSADINAGILGTLPNTTVFYVDNINGEWGHTSYNGVSGWVYLDYCDFMFSLNEFCTVTAEPSLNLRSTHAKTDNIIGTIPAGAVIQITDKYRDSSYLWGKTTYNGKTGWAVVYNFDTTSYYTSPKIPMKLSDISVTFAPTKLTYYEGEKLDCTGIVLTAWFSDGVWKRITDTSAFSCTGFESTAGNKTIIVTYTYAGVTKTASFGVTVKNNTPISGVVLNLPSAELYLGSEFTLTAKLSPTNATNKTVLWSSNDSKIASVNYTGTVEAKAAGTAVIKCISYITPAVFTQCALTVLPSPLIPDAFKAVPSSDNAVTLSWAPLSGVSQYILYVSDSPSGPFSKLTATNLTSFTQTGLTCGKEYFYEIRACRLLGTVTVSEKLSAPISAVPFPAVPGNPKAAPATYNSINLSWEPVPAATGYVVYLSSSPTGPFGRLAVTKSAAYLHKDLICGSTYFYKVRAYTALNGKNTYGTPSAPITATALPPVPANFTAHKATATGIKLAWSVSPGATGYVLYRSETSNGPFLRYKATKALSFTDTGLTAGKTYYYKVRAYRAGDKINIYGTPSAWISFKL